MKSLLYGDELLEPAEVACVKLTQEFFKEDTCQMLIASLPDLDPGTRQDVTHVIANLQRQRVNERYLASEYLECHTTLLTMLLSGWCMKLNHEVVESLKMITRQSSDILGHFEILLENSNGFRSI